MKSEKERKQLLRILDKLNADVARAIDARTKWMNEHMSDFSKFQIGDSVYDRQGRKLGTVTELYRYWADQNAILDDDMSIHARFLYEGSGNYYGNTSSEPYNRFTKDEVKEHLQRNLQSL